MSKVDFVATKKIWTEKYGECQEKVWECPSCLEDLPTEKMAFCDNGHPAGCQKCHMKLVISNYMQYQNFNIVFCSGKNTQKCFICRENLPNCLVGKDWSIKVQSLMIPLIIKSGKYTHEQLEGNPTKKLQDQLRKGNEKGNKLEKEKEGWKLTAFMLNSAESEQEGWDALGTTDESVWWKKWMEVCVYVEYLQKKKN